MTTNSTHLNHIKRTLDRWDMRYRALQSLIWLPRGLLAGLAAGLLVAIAARLWPLLPRQTVLLLGGVLAFTGVIAALLAVWLWRRSTIQMARLFDRAFGLKERMSAAVELAGGRLPVESEALAGRQYRQAMQTASQVNPAHGLPLRADWREWAGVGVALGVLALAIFLPNPQEAVLAQQAEIEQAITEELEELEALREEVLEDPGLTVDEKEAVIETLDEAIETLEQSGVSQEEALAALDAAEQELRDLSEQFAETRREALQEASSLFNDTAAEDVAEALEAGNFLEAAEALSNLDIEGLSPEEQQALAESLAEAAEALEGSNPALAESLADAAGALAEGDTGAAAEALQDAAGEMADAGEGSTAEVDEYAGGVDKAQAGVAGAGKDQAGQPGQGGMGQAPQAGEGSGQGQGSSGGGAGRGEGSGETPGGVAGGEMPTDNGPGDGGETPFDDVYSPQRIGGEGGEDVDIPGDPGAGLPTGAEGDFVENPSGTSNVPYDQVWADYADSVNEAMRNGAVPLGLRDLIRQYFSRLDPQ